MKKATALQVLIFTVFSVIFCDSVEISAQSSGVLADETYEDPNGFFRITPPAGWSIKTYSNDPRGKVKFTAPSLGGVSILVIGMATQMTTTKEIVASTTRDMKRLKERYRTQNPTGSHEIIKFDGADAVRGQFELQGIMRQLSFEFLRGNIYYSVVFAAPPERYKDYIEIGMQSINTLEPLVKAITSEEAKKHMAAGKLRVAEIAFKEGRKDIAMRAVKEGLQFDPENQELKALETMLKK